MLFEAVSACDGRLEALVGAVCDVGADVDGCAAGVAAVDWIGTDDSAALEANRWGTPELDTQRSRETERESMLVYTGTSFANDRVRTWHGHHEMVPT